MSIDEQNTVLEYIRNAIQEETKIRLSDLEIITMIQYPEPEIEIMPTTRIQPVMPNHAVFPAITAIAGIAGVETSNWFGTVPSNGLSH